MHHPIFNNIFHTAVSQTQHLELENGAEPRPFVGGDDLGAP